MRELDRPWLGEYIQPQHLDERALEDHRMTFATQSVPYLQLSDFLPAEYAQMMHSFMSLEADYEHHYGLHSANRRVEHQAWLDAADEDRFYSFSVLSGQQPEISSFNPFVYMKLCQSLADVRFIDFFKRISQLPLGELETVRGHAFGAGDFLRPHNDNTKDRLLAFIIYLAPEWTPGYGGTLHIVAADGREITLKSEFNSLVMFDVKGHESHFVTEIGASAGVHRRLSLGGWYK